MPIETLDDIVEQIANWCRVYGAHVPELLDPDPTQAIFRYPCTKAQRGCKIAGMEALTQEQKQAVDEYLSIIHGQLHARIAREVQQQDSLDEMASRGEICFIRWPYMTLGDMNDKAAFYAERDEWNATTIGASD